MAVDRPLGDEETRADLHVREAVADQSRDLGSPLPEWTMNADGTEQTRLTNSPTDDVGPTWR